MKVLFIIPGAGDQFYCGNCFRDNLYASALREAGHEVIISPLYLPIKHESFQINSPLFFPATTYYMAHKFFKKGNMPKWIEKLTGSEMMLNVAASKSGTTSPKGLEAMTLSMINGEDATFQAEINKLTDWIKNQEKPDIIHISSSLLIGIAKHLHTHLQLPIVCSLQDEEVWIDNMDENYANIAWQQISENTRFVNKLITTSEYYKTIAHQKMGTDHDIEVVYPGFDQTKYEKTKAPADPVIGFFYRMNEINGLHILVDAFIKLKEQNSIPNLKLKIGGGYNDQDRHFIKSLKNQLAPYINDVEFCENYSLDEHKGFYESISIISVPITFDEGIGLYLCEAFSAGVPAVEPSTGSFPEVVGDAGVLYQPNSADALADAITKALSDKEYYNQLKDNAKKLASTRYNSTVMVGKLLEVYNQCYNQ
nr:glycosyltransferase family 4 protein [uncultured Carboxylicivirga sp.]